MCLRPLSLWSRALAASVVSSTGSSLGQFSATAINCHETIVLLQENARSSERQSKYKHSQRIYLCATLSSAGSNEKMHKNV